MSTDDPSPEATHREPIGVGLRAGLPPLPRSMLHLPLDARGYPVPYFVSWVNGEPDFRVANGQKWDKCVRHSRCWVCGEPIGKFKTFVIGPMCAINRTTGEPPCHLRCAVFSATACPFLTLPKAKRNDANLPPEHYNPGGIMELRNPGVTCLWHTLSYRVFDAGNGYLIQIGPPLFCHWYTEKRLATRAEVLASIDSGMPRLHDLAELDRDKAGSHALLDRQYADILPLLPDQAL